jgi:hypothetical protein
MLQEHDFSPSHRVYERIGELRQPVRVWAVASLHKYAPSPFLEDARSCRESRGPSAKLMALALVRHLRVSSASVATGVLHEALTRRADPLYLALVFSLSLYLT